MTKRNKKKGFISKQGLITGLGVLAISLIVGAGGFLLYRSTITPNTVVTTREPEYQEAPLMTQVNAVRAKNNKKALSEDPNLMAAAQRKVADQVARNYPEHHIGNEDTFQFLKPLVGSNYYHLAENLSECGASDSERVQGWINSPGHFKTMVGDFDGFGWAQKYWPKRDCILTVTYYIKY